jgi:hypothetical protein
MRTTRWRRPASLPSANACTQRLYYTRLWPTGLEKQIVEASALRPSITAPPTLRPSIWVQSYGDINPAVNTIHTLVAVQDANGWRAALFQSTPAAWHGRPQDTAALTEELRAVMRRGLTCR